MPLRMQSRTSGRSSRASGACSFAAAFGWCEAGLEFRDLAFMAKLYRQTAWDTIPLFGDLD